MVVNKIIKIRKMIADVLNISIDDVVDDLGVVVRHGYLG